MKMNYRAAMAALVLAGAAIIGSGGANAAAGGQFSPLPALSVGSGATLELANYRERGWGRRCYRECHVGRHGRTFCSWECYRPRRWW
jgi:hypothetical protein